MTPPPPFLNTLEVWRSDLGGDYDELMSELDAI